MKYKSLYIFQCVIMKQKHKKRLSKSSIEPVNSYNYAVKNCVVV